MRFQVFVNQNGKRVQFSINAKNLAELIELLNRMFGENSKRVILDAQK